MNTATLEKNIGDALEVLGELPPGKSLTQRFGFVRERGSAIAGVTDETAVPPPFQAALPPHRTIAHDQMGELTAEVDLLLSPMTALRMFPADSAPAIERAVTEKIPVWLFISGIEMLADRDEFLNNRLPAHRAKLPEGSEVFVSSRTTSESEAERLGRLWSERSEELFRVSRTRRVQAFLRQCVAEVGEARASAAQRLNDFERSLETGQHGVEAQKIQARLVPRALDEVAESIRTVIDSWLGTIENELFAGGQDIDPDKLKKKLEREIESLVTQMVGQAISGGLSKTAAVALEWHDSRGAEVERFFRPFWIKSGCASDLANLCAHGKGVHEDRVRQWSAALGPRLEKSVSAMRSYLQGSWLAEVCRLIRMPVTRKGKLPSALTVEKVRREVERNEIIRKMRDSAKDATETLATILHEAKVPLADILTDNLETLASACLREASGVMVGHEAALRRLQLAESHLLKA